MFKRINKYFNDLLDARQEAISQYTDKFLYAAETGDLKTLSKHYENGGDPKGALSRAGIFSAAKHGNSAAVDFLLGKGVPARSRYLNKTAEQAARENGHTEIADKLQNLSRLQIPSAKPNTP